MSAPDGAPSVVVVVVGGGFKLGVAVTLLDQHNHHQFQPLLYQGVTAELAPTDIARPRRAIFDKRRLARRACLADERRPATDRRVRVVGWDFLGSNRASSIIDDTTPRIGWGDTPEEET